MSFTIFTYKDFLNSDMLATPWGFYSPTNLWAASNACYGQKCRNIHLPAPEVTLTSSIRMSGSYNLTIWLSADYFRVKDTIDFTFAFDGTIGTNNNKRLRDTPNMPTFSSFGENIFQDTIPLHNWTDLVGWTTRTHINHTGTATPIVFPGGEWRLLPISIGYSFILDPNDTTDVGYEQMDFHITGASINLPTPVDGPPRSVPSNPPTPRQKNVAAIAGGTLGGIGLALLAFLLWWILIRQRPKAANKAVPPPKIPTPPMSETYHPERPEGGTSPITPLISPSWVQPLISNAAPPAGVYRTPSDTTSLPGYHAYSSAERPSPMQGYPTTPTMHVANPSHGDQVHLDPLGEFASTNRGVISVDLERRLRLASYLPTNDPNSITVDVWREQYGIETFELTKLRELYERTRPLEPRLKS